MERKALGRGLSSLVGGLVVEDQALRILRLPIDEIQPNPQQPRQEWDEEALAGLAESIRANGVLQPLLVRGRAGSYELIAGERRLRAARIAGLTHVPAVIRETDEEGSLQLALIENIQREDISALDAAVAYQQLISRFGMTQEQVSAAVGKSRSAVANTLRLLKLPQAILESLRRREISEGHARALLAIEDPAQRTRFWKLACKGASVREIEAGAHPTAAEPGSGTNLGTVVRRSARLAPHLEALVDRLRRSLGVKVEIRGDDRGGVLSLEYYSEEDLQSLADRLLQE